MENFLALWVSYESLWEMSLTLADNQLKVPKEDVMTKTDQKVLRIGLVKDGKVVQERLLEKPRPVTIGTSDRCTFQLAVDGLPPVYPLIKIHQRQYTLQFSTKMTGKLMVGDTPDSMKTLDFKKLHFKKLPYKAKFLIGDHNLSSRV